MNTFKLERPLYLYQYEALLRRLPQRHPQYAHIEKDYRKYLTGFQGEESLDYILTMLNLPKEAFICRGLRLKNKANDYFFQIDLLIVTPHFLYIGEVKNHTGKLIFEPNYGQMIQLKGEASTTYPCPLQQSKRQGRQLKNWLSDNKFKEMPISAHAVISNPYTQISSNNPIPELYHADLLPEILDSLQLTYSKRIFTSIQMKKLESLLRKENEEANHFLLEKYNLPIYEVLNSIYCPHCFSRRLQRYRKQWYCTSCRARDNHIHLQGLQDLALLNVGYQSLSTYRKFLAHASAATVKGLISPFVLQNEYKCKGRKYKLELDKF